MFYGDKFPSDGARQAVETMIYALMGITSACSVLGFLRSTFFGMLSSLRDKTSTRLLSKEALKEVKEADDQLRVLYQRFFDPSVQDSMIR